MAEAARGRNLRPTKAELQASYDVKIPDLIADDLLVLLVGINPSLWSGWAGVHFARPTNRLWPTLHQAGLTESRLDPTDTDGLLASGIGITNLVARSTTRADELTRQELLDGVPILAATVERHQPRVVAFLGLSTYRIAYASPRATVGRQDARIEGRPVWLLPNPSGLNAHYQQADLSAAYRDLREFAVTVKS